MAVQVLAILGSFLQSWDLSPFSHHEKKFDRSVESTATFSEMCKKFLHIADCRHLLDRPSPIIAARKVKERTEHVCCNLQDYMTLAQLVRQNFVKPPNRKTMQNCVLNRQIENQACCCWKRLAFMLFHLKLA